MKRTSILVVTCFCLFFLLLISSVGMATEIEQDGTTCSMYNEYFVNDTFRYLDEIYIEKYPALGLRFMYGTPNDKQMLSDLAEVITDGCETDREKANAIESWIQRNIEYSSGSAYPVDTFYNRFGDCQSYAQLMVALLRLQGIPAAWGDGWRGDMEMLTIDGLSNLGGHAWCYAYLDGEWVMYDPLWFSGGTTDKEYIAKWYYLDMVEGIVPVYDGPDVSPLQLPRNYYKNGRFFANTNLIVNNLWLLTTAYTYNDGYSYVDSEKSESAMVSGEAYRDGWVRAGSMIYIYENGIHASGAVIEDEGKLYYADIQSSHAFEILCQPEDYTIAGGYFSVAPGYEGRLLKSTNFDYGVESGTETYTVIYESDDPSIASIDEDGVVTTYKEGLAFISAHFYRDSDGTYMGSGSVYGLYVWNDTRIAEFTDVYTDHEHRYKAIEKDAYILYTCTVGDCADSHRGKILVDDHAYTAVKTEGTCIRAGYTTYTCTCGHQYVEEDGELQEHTWGNWDEDVSSGIPKRVCAYCGLSEYRGVLANGTCGESVVWFLMENGCLNIYGTGDMTDYYFSGSPWIGYCDRITNVVIDEGVTSVGGYAFAWCSNLTQVTLPESLLKIGEWAFHACEALPQIKIPDGVISIGTQAFYLCTNLANVNIPHGLDGLGVGIFMDCSSLTSMDIPTNITYIGNHALDGCNGLTEIVIPYGVAEIGFGAFQSCTGLENIVIPDTVVTIDGWAFASCTNLARIELPESVTVLGEGLFYNCTSLTSVHIPDSVVKIKGALFARCMNLKEVTISDNHPYFSMVDGVLFTKNQHTLLEYMPYLTAKSYTIPAATSVIGKSAFSGQAYLEQVVIPQNIGSVGHAVFNDCAVLHAIYFRGDAPYFSSNMWLDNVTATIYYPQNNDTWTAQIMGNYFGNITWVAYGPCEDVHSYGEGVVSKEATCTEAGEKTYTCVYCGDSYTERIPTIDHRFVGGECTDCGEKIIIPLGDVNGDGAVDTTDAKLIMQYDLGYVNEEDINLAAMDVNGDGKIDTTDAKLIMQLDLGVITEFPKP